MVTISIVCLLYTDAVAQPQTVQSLRVDQCSELESSEEQARKRARDLYDKGLVLYEQGDYQGAVDAFVSSYCSKAHYASYYNIAQSYERLLDFERSILYFERYVREAEVGDPDTQKAKLRANVLRNLPAQLRVATVPPGATITIRNSSRITARGTANRARGLEVAAGTYTMSIQLPGYEGIETTLTTKPGLPYAYTFSLKPKTSLLEVTVAPSKSRIFLDDRLVAVGRYSEELDLGTYTLTIEAVGRPVHTEEIEIVEEQPVVRSIELLAPPEGGHRTLLIAAPVAMVLMGGATMNQLFGINSSLSAAGSLVSTGLGFAGAYYGIPKSTTRGDAWYMIESGLIGAAEGVMLGSYFTCVRGKKNCNQSVITGTTLIGTLAGMTFSALTYKDWRLSSGTTALVGTGGLWGISVGALLYTAFDSEDEILLPMLFTGMNIGVATAVGLASSNRVSLRRVAVINLAGLAGILGGTSLAAALQSDGEQVQHLALLGGITGLTVGTFLTRYMDTGAALPTGSSPKNKAEQAWSPSIGNSRDARGQSVLQLGLRRSF